MSSHRLPIKSEQLLFGLFATGEYGLPTPTGADTSTVVKGLFYGGGFGQLKAQAIGSGAVCLATFVVAMVLMYAVKATGTLRVSREGELEGLDIHEHGAPAYPEFVTAWGKTLAAPPSPVGSEAPQGSSLSVSTP